MKGGLCSEGGGHMWQREDMCGEGGCAWQEGYARQGTCEQVRRPPKWAVCILLECILV